MAKTIGFLGATNEQIWGEYKDAFERQLTILGAAGGQEVVVRYEWANGNKQAYTDIAKRFVAAPSPVNAIVTSGTEPVIAASREAAASGIPVFFASAGGPVPAGAIGTLNDQKDKGLAKERFKILKKIYKRQGLPDPIVAVMGQFGLDNVKEEKNNICGTRGAAKEFEIEAKEYDITDFTADQIRQAIVNLEAATALLYVCTDPRVTTLQADIINAANGRKLPTMFAFREYVENGGLLSFGADFKPMFVTAANNVHAFLSQPSLIKKMRSSFALSFELVLNTSTERLIDAAIPPSVRHEAEKWPPGST